MTRNNIIGVEQHNENILSTLEFYLKYPENIEAIKGITITLLLLNRFIDNQVLKNNSGVIQIYLQTLGKIFENLSNQSTKLNAILQRKWLISNINAGIKDPFNPKKQVGLLGSNPVIQELQDCLDQLLKVVYSIIKSQRNRTPGNTTPPTVDIVDTTDLKPELTSNTKGFNLTLLILLIVQILGFESLKEANRFIESLNVESIIIQNDYPNIEIPRNLSSLTLLGVQLKEILESKGYNLNISDIKSNLLEENESFSVIEFNQELSIQIELKLSDFWDLENSNPLKEELNTFLLSPTTQRATTIWHAFFPDSQQPSENELLEFSYLLLIHISCKVGVIDNQSIQDFFPMAILNLSENEDGIFPGVDWLINSDIKTVISSGLNFYCPQASAACTYSVENSTRALMHFNTRFGLSPFTHELIHFIDNKMDYLNLLEFREVVAVFLNNGIVASTNSNASIIPSIYEDRLGDSFNSELTYISQKYLLEFLEVLNNNQASIYDFIDLIANKFIQENKQQEVRSQFNSTFSVSATIFFQDKILNQNDLIALQLSLLYAHSIFYADNKTTEVSTIFNKIISHYIPGLNSINVDLTSEIATQLQNYLLNNTTRQEINDYFINVDRPNFNTLAMEVRRSLINLNILPNSISNYIPGIAIESSISKALEVVYTNNSALYFQFIAWLQQGIMPENKAFIADIFLTSFFKILLIEEPSGLQNLKYLAKNFFTKDLILDELNFSNKSDLTYKDAEQTLETQLEDLINIKIDMWIQNPSRIEYIVDIYRNLLRGTKNEPKSIHFFKQSLVEDLVLNKLNTSGFTLNDPHSRS